MLLGACRMAWMGAAYHLGQRIVRAGQAAGREALSVYKAGRADQSAAEAGGTRDRRRNQCPTSGDEQAPPSAEGGHQDGHEQRGGCHLLAFKWVLRRKVPEDAVFSGCTRPYCYMP